MPEHILGTADREERPDGAPFIAFARHLVTHTEHRVEHVVPACRLGRAECLERRP
jgi:hypothetical protein